MCIEGTLTGVQVLEHAEAPGLGDRIEPEKSDWLAAFRGRSVASPAHAYWSITRDGGAFDQMTGASITSPAVVRPLRDTPIYAAQPGTVLRSAAAENPGRPRRAVENATGSSGRAPASMPAGHG